MFPFFLRVRTDKIFPQKLFSDDLRTTGDTRGICMKTGYYSSIPIIFFLVIVEKLIFFCTWEISSLYHYSSPFRLSAGDVSCCFVSHCCE